MALDSLKLEDRFQFELFLSQDIHQCSPCPTECMIGIGTSFLLLHMEHCTRTKVSMAASRVRLKCLVWSRSPMSAPAARRSRDKSGTSEAEINVGVLFLKLDGVDVNLDSLAARPPPTSGTKSSP